MRTKVCVITASGKRVCGRPTTKASGAGRSAKQHVPEGVERMFDRLAEQIAQRSARMYRCEFVEDGLPAEDMTAVVGSHEATLRYRSFHPGDDTSRVLGYFTVNERKRDGTGSHTTDHATFADATQKFLALVTKFGG